MTHARTDAASQPVALVTGASGGIGAATAWMLAAKGYRLLLVGRSSARIVGLAQELQSAMGVPIAWHIADLSDWDQAAAAVAHAESTFGRLDALINNAGDATPATIAQTDRPLADAAIGVNLLGPMAMIVAAWPGFLRRRQGRVVNVSSMATLDPFPSLFAYAAAKAGTNVMARSIVNEARAAGIPDIHAFAVAPGAVETKMLRAIVSERDLPPDRALAPQAVAEVIVACVEGRNDHRSGEVIAIPSP